jgi:hypothetical protein
MYNLELENNHFRRMQLTQVYSKTEERKVIRPVRK